MQYTSTERGFIERVLDAPAEAARRLAYAAWLDTEGDALRATILRATCPMADERTELEALLAQLPAEREGWARLLGARLVHEAQTRGFGSLVDRWLPLAKPAIDLAIGEPTEGIPVGASRFFGDPDLPRGTPWPTLADCSRWEPEIELEPTSPCQFIAQINLAELAGSPAARALPQQGLLSIFTHHEWERTGSAGIRLRYFRDLSTLRRVPHAEADEFNGRMEPHAMRLTEALTVPASRGPLSEEVGLVGSDYDTSSKYFDLACTTGTLFGLLGYDRPTTGDDPTPGAQWERLLVLPVDPWAGCIHHLSIESAKLAAGELEDHRLVWVDFDGA